MRVNTGDSLAGLLAVRRPHRTDRMLIPGLPIRTVVLGTDFYSLMVFMLFIRVCLCVGIHTRMCFCIYIIPMSGIKPVRHVVVSFPGSETYFLESSVLPG